MSNYFYVVHSKEEKPDLNKHVNFQEFRHAYFARNILEQDTGRPYNISTITKDLPEAALYNIEVVFPIKFKVQILATSLFEAMEKAKSQEDIKSSLISELQEIDTSFFAPRVKIETLYRLNRDLIDSRSIDEDYIDELDLN